MSKLSDTADAAIQFGEKFRAVAEIGVVLKSLGSIEQATEERKAALVTATAAHEAKLAEVATAQAELDAARAAQADELAASQAEVKQILSDARTAAADLKGKAQTKADAVIAAATAEVARIQDNHAQTMNAAQASLETTRATLDEIQGRVNAAVAEHAAVKKKTDALRKAAQSIVGTAE